MNKKTIESEIVSYEYHDTETKEFVSIPRGVYMSRSHQRHGRCKQSHTCIEMTYILSGSATHSIQIGNGEVKQEPLTIGNYYILDYNSSHMIHNPSPDFFLVNLLFQPSFMDSSLDKYEPFDNLLKNIFHDVHITTLKESVENRVYFDSDKSIRPIFEKAWETYNLREPGYRNLLQCYISEIIILSTKKMLPKELSRKHEVIAIRDYVNEHYMDDISLRSICKERFINMSYISRKFKEIIGVSFETYLQNIRVQNACTLLIETDDSIDTIIEKVGYKDNSSFRKNFRRLLNTTPLKFRQLHR